MKKVILSAAVLACATFANAQTSSVPVTADITFNTGGEDIIALTMSTNLPNWIDLNPENTSFSTAQPASLVNTTGWNTLDDGWDLATQNFSVSSTRAANVSITGNYLNRAGGTANTAGNTIPAGRLSVAFSKTSYTADHYNVNEAAWTVNSGWGSASGNRLAASQTAVSGTIAAQDAIHSTAGGHNIQFSGTFSAYKGLGHNAADYYNDNLIGGTYSGTISMRAYYN